MLLLTVSIASLAICMVTATVVAGLPDTYDYLGQSKKRQLKGVSLYLIHVELAHPVVCPKKCHLVLLVPARTRTFMCK